MVGSGTATFADPGDYAAAVSGARLNMVLAAVGEFRAQLTWVELSDASLYRCRESVPRIASITVDSTMVAVAFPIDRNSRQIWDGVTARPGDLVVLGHDGAHQRLEQCSKGGGQWGLIVVAAAALAAHGRALRGRTITVPPATTVLRPRPSLDASLRRLHAKAIRLARERPEILVQREVVRALDHELLDALTACLTADSSRSPDAAPVRSRRPGKDVR